MQEETRARLEAALAALDGTRGVALVLPGRVAKFSAAELLELVREAGKFRRLDPHLTPELLRRAEETDAKGSES